MAITVEYLTGLGIEKDVAEKIFKERGKEIAKEQATQATVEDLKNQLKQANETISTITTELDGLKANNASAEEWKQKYETLQHDVSEKERIAKEEAAAAEKKANLQARYSAVCVSRDGNALEWTHDAIKDAYFAKFMAAVEDKANQGKSDADIFNNLIKDDATAFKGVQAVTLVGGKPLGMSDKKMTREDISKIKDPIERREKIAENIKLFENTEE
ncbi:MAG: hypothetical protein HFE51_04975 [Clostridia bacterium]|nr:hypothetical protein [Clostridia bacterium]